MNYSEFISRTAAISRPSPIRVYARIARESTPPLVNMGPGLPNDDMTFLVGAKFEMRDGTTLQLTEEDMRVAQQYNNSDGIPPLREWLTELVVKMHNPPTYGDADKDKEMQVIVNAGNIQGISSAANVLLSRGDRCLVPEYYYGAFVEVLRRVETNAMTYKMEEDGPNIVSLEEMLSQFDPADEKKWAERPRMFFIIPNGSNPTGETTSLEKRHKIYALARKYDFVIVEDDSYFFLQFNEPRLPSFLSMDVDGRVIRCDSFSKVLGAGFRVGWVSGPRALVSRMLFEVQYSIQHASIFAQVVVNRMVRQWGFDEFIRKADKVRDGYLHRRAVILQAVETHLQGLATWVVPQAGMFFWVKIPAIQDTVQFVTSHAVKNGVLIIPGGIFTLDQSGPCPYVRIAFSVCSEHDLEMGIKKLAEAIRDATEDSKQ